MTTTTMLTICNQCKQLVNHLHANIVQIKLQYEIKYRKIATKRANERTNWWLIDRMCRIVWCWFWYWCFNKQILKKHLISLLTIEWCKVKSDDAIICYDTKLYDVEKMNWLIRKDCWLSITRVKTLWFRNNHLLVI